MTPWDPWDPWDHCQALGKIILVFTYGSGCAARGSEGATLCLSGPNVDQTDQTCRELKNWLIHKDVDVEWVDISGWRQNVCVWFSWSSKNMVLFRRNFTTGYPFKTSQLWWETALVVPDYPQHLVTIATLIHLLWFSILYHVGFPEGTIQSWDIQSNLRITWIWLQQHVVGWMFIFSAEIPCVVVR